MSTYVREKVLRVPYNKLNFGYVKKCLKEKYTEEELEDDLEWCIDESFPKLFKYATPTYFQFSPTEECYIDYVLEYEWDSDGEYGKIRELYDSEKEKYRPIFQQIDPEVDMDCVKLVEFCWYNGTEAPDYYDEKEDDFYNEV